MSDRLPQLLADLKAKGLAHYVRGENDEAALLEGYYVDEDYGRHVCRFFEGFLYHSKGKWAGKPYILSEHNKSILMPLYSWRRPDGRRRFKVAQIWKPKKNGKSSDMSGLAVYHLRGDGEKGAEVYCLANDREQAGIVFRSACDMVKASKALNRELVVVQSKKQIIWHSNSWIQALAADAATAEGKNASCWIIDEIHAFNERGRDLREAMRYAGAAREQPMEIIISTAGDEAGPGHDEYLFAKAVELGESAGGVRALDVFVSIHEADPKDDWTDPAIHAKANPHYGITIDPEEMTAECEKAKQNPRLAASFKRYRLNQWTSSETPWLDAMKWKGYAADLDEKELKSLPCCGGLDLSSTTDLTAWAIAWKRKDGTFISRVRFWLPADNISDRENEDRVPYRQWANDGWLTLTPGREIDYTYVAEQMAVDWKEYGIHQIGFDKYLAGTLLSLMRTNYGIGDAENEEGKKRGMVAMPQLTPYLHLGSKALEDAVNTTGKMVHDGNPIMARHVASVRAYTDTHGKIRPVKCDAHKRRVRIDGVAALVNAVSRLIVMKERRGGLTLTSFTR